MNEFIIIILIISLIITFVYLFYMNFYRKKIEYKIDQLQKDYDNLYKLYSNSKLELSLEKDNNKKLFLIIKDFFKDQTIIFSKNIN